MPTPELQVKIGAVITDLEKNLAKAQRSLEKFSKKSKDLGKQFKSTGLTMSKALTIPLGILGGLALKTAADFETLNTALITTFKGNQKAAKAAFDQIIEFASKTPFQVEQVASAFIKLKNFGLEPSQKALESYGNTAAAMGKSLDQMVEAVADAATGEFERLKEFGIKAKSEGDKVELTFRGVTTTVKKEAAAIEGYLMGLGETEFAGGMIAQSKTFAGTLSTLKDNVSLLAKEFGDILIPMLAPIVKKIGDLAKKFRELSPELKKTIVVVGLVAAAIGPLLATIGFLMTNVIPGLVVAFGGLKVAVLATAGAFQTLTAAMLANPFALVAAGVAALVAGFTTMLQKISPMVSKLKTFFNLVKSGFDHAKFLELQMIDVAEAMEEESMEAGKVNRELEILAMNQKIAAAAAQELATQLNEVADARERGARAAVKGAGVGVTGFTGGGTAKPEKPVHREGVDASKVLRNLKAIGVKVKEETEGMIGQIDIFNEKASLLIEGAIADTFGKLGESIGKALATGGNVLKAVGNSILSSLGAFIGKMGDLLIKYGTLAVLKGKLDIAILAGGPASIAAGIAAIAVGVALKAAGSALGQAAQGGGSTRDVLGDTGGSGRPGGFASSSTSGSSFRGGNVVFEIAGTKLVGVLSNTLNKNKALGGNNTLALT